MTVSSNATGLTTAQPVLPVDQPNVPLAAPVVMPAGYLLIPKKLEAAPWVETPSAEAIRIMNTFGNDLHGDMRGSSLKLDGWLQESTIPGLFIPRVDATRTLYQPNVSSEPEHVRAALNQHVGRGVDAAVGIYW